MKSLWPNWDRLGVRIAAAPGVALITDFDGTLSPIVARPAEARLPAEIKKALLGLSGVPRCHVMVLSGRRLADVRKRVGIRSFYYGGNHGLEISGPGFSFVHPAAKALRPRVRTIAAEASIAMRGIPGALTEDKGLSLSIHFRGVPSRSLTDFRCRMRRFRESTDGEGFRWRRGLMIWELLPCIDWDKGQAALMFLDRFGISCAVGIGDDTTDEDMFKALKVPGFSVRTCFRKRSSAEYHLEGQRDVRRFIERFRKLFRDEGANEN